MTEATATQQYQRVHHLPPARTSGLIIVQGLGLTRPDDAEANMTDEPIKPISNPIGPNAKQPRVKRNPSLKLGTVSDPVENNHVVRSGVERDAAFHDPVDVTPASTSDSVAQAPTETRPSRETKKSRAIALLRTETGIAIAELSTALGWQQHTTRATLSGMRKAGFAFVVERPAGGSARIYRIVDGAEPTLPARVTE